MSKDVNLNAREVAALLQIPVVKVQRWVHQGKIPCKFKDNAYYFKKKEVLEWAKSHNLLIQNAEKKTEKPDQDDSWTLKQGIENGGVFFDLEGDDIFNVLKNAVGRIAFPPPLDKELIFEELISREEMASTGIGKGVAIPHPRRNLDLKLEIPIISVFFLKNRIDFNSIDGKPVFVLFMMFSPSPTAHLNLLSRLSFLLRDRDFLQELEACSNKENLIALIETKEMAIKTAPPRK